MPGSAKQDFERKGLAQWRPDFGGRLDIVFVQVLEQHRDLEQVHFWVPLRAVPIGYAVDEFVAEAQRRRMVRPIRDET